MSMSDINFGKRRCQICQSDIPAQTFGRHVFNEHGALIIATRWPGGTRGFLEALLESINESLASSSSFPGVQQSLLLQRDVIVGLLHKLPKR